MTHSAKIFIWTAALFATAGALGCSSTVEPERVALPVSALVTFAFTGKPADTMKVFISDTATISAAQSFIATGRGPHLLIGTIIRGAGVDTRYPFQFVPQTVRLVDAAIELCDGAPMQTSSDVDDFIQGATGNRAASSATWCPWSSYPVQVQLLLPD